MGVLCCKNETGFETVDEKSHKNLETMVLLLLTVMLLATTYIHASSAGGWEKRHRLVTNRVIEGPFVASAESLVVVSYIQGTELVWTYSADFGVNFAPFSVLVSGSNPRFGLKLAASTSSSANPSFLICSVTSGAVEIHEWHGIGTTWTGTSVSSSNPVGCALSEGKDNQWVAMLVSSDGTVRYLQRSKVPAQSSWELLEGPLGIVPTSSISRDFQNNLALLHMSLSCTYTGTCTMDWYNPSGNNRVHMNSIAHSGQTFQERMSTYTPVSRFPQATLTTDDYVGVFYFDSNRYLRCVWGVPGSFQQVDPQYTPVAGKTCPSVRAVHSDINTLNINVAVARHHETGVITLLMMEGAEGKYEIGYVGISNDDGATWSTETSFMTMGMRTNGFPQFCSIAVSAQSWIAIISANDQSTSGSTAEIYSKSHSHGSGISSAAVATKHPTTLFPSLSPSHVSTSAPVLVATQVPTSNPGLSETQSPTSETQSPTSHTPSRTPTTSAPSSVPDASSTQIPSQAPSLDATPAPSEEIPRNDTHQIPFTAAVSSAAVATSVVLAALFHAALLVSRYGDDMRLLSC